MNRYIKIALIAFVALQGLIGGIGNLAGLAGGQSGPSSMYNAVAGVLFMEGVPASVPRVFAVDSPVFVWIGVCWIVLLKLATGISGIIGVWQLWQSRRAPSGEFQAAKRWGLIACGLSILMLFGGFIVIGTTILFMWMTEFGRYAFESATYLLVALGIVALFVNARDD